MQRYKIIVAYDGANYSGWQLQPDYPSIQGELEKALLILSGEKVTVHSSGRTDAGVHARGQVAHFDLEKKFVVWRLFRGLNSQLAKDIRVLEVKRCPPAFHARFDAVGKEYRYFIWNHPADMPVGRGIHHHVYRPLNVKAMRLAAAQLTGTHDFAAFSANPRREIDGTVRTVSLLKVDKRFNEIVIRVRGDGFLYKMVRSLAGYLVRVGTGELDVASAKTILESKTRTARVPTSSAQGLVLWKVFYAPKKSKQ